ncbi:MAG: archaeosortase/exosortase family protein [Kordiimonadaceae bacterium]|nr:archaeosortase/exosortase family protein [Kordiimonadaceae bacterium]MBO6570771.1 archaeosortase/exosortase family protein [Kordiimonadaceae bacterium]MBO6965452.1 archaeosortase/exosortase family protein [Kordiimonadaceae bacterium]
MQPFLHKRFVLVQSSAAGLLLGPYFAVSVFNERWPLLALALASMILILAGQRTPPRHQTISWLTPLATVLVAFGLIFGLDKLLLVSGALFLSGTLFSLFPVSRLAAFSVIGCACLMVPLPTAIETNLANELAEIEAAVFVIIGQAAGLPVRLSGAQVFFEQSVVTINQDCSGTLLLVPAALGAMTAAALAGTRKSALAAIASAAPIALLINLARIGIVLALIASGDFAAADAWHDGLGFFALTVSWAVPILMFTNLNTIQFTRPVAANVMPIAAVMIIVGLASGLAIPLKRDVQAGPFKLPAYVNGWVAEDIGIPTQELKILNANHTSRQRFTSNRHEFVVTAIQHFDPRIGREHSSERCFKAMGWQVEMLGRQPFNGNGKLTYLTATSGGYTQSVLEFEMLHAQSMAGFIRIQLVADAATPHKDQLDFLSAFVANIFGETS